MPNINSPTPDATTTSKGKVQLAGDLGGTAASPTVLQITRNPYKFSAIRTTAQALGTATSTTVIFTTEDYDTSNNYNNATGVFTAPASGFYQFNSAVSLSASSSTTTYISIFKNGTEFRRGTRVNTSGTQGMNISALISLATNDTVDIRVLTTVSFSTEAVALGATYFDGHLVSLT